MCFVACIDISFNTSVCFSSYFQHLLVIHIFAQLFIQPPFHRLSSTHSLARSFVRASIHSFVCPPVRSSVSPSINQSLQQSLLSYIFHSSVHLFVHSFIRPSIYSSIHLFVHPFIRPFIYSSIHVFVHPFIRPYICSYIHFRMIRLLAASLPFACFHGILVFLFQLLHDRRLPLNLQ